MSDCIYLGPDTGKRQQVKCLRIEGSVLVKPVYECLHPERIHRRTGRPKPCIPHWPGPWHPEREAEASIYPLCDGAGACRCELRPNG